MNILTKKIIDDLNVFTIYKNNQANKVIQEMIVLNNYFKFEDLSKPLYASNQELFIKTLKVTFQRNSFKNSIRIFIIII